VSFDDIVSTPSLGITSHGCRPSGEESSISFNSLSRDHTARVGYTLNRVAIKAAFNSLSRDHEMVGNMRNDVYINLQLSTPSLGITRDAHADPAPLPVAHFQLPLSGSHVKSKRVRLRNWQGLSTPSLGITFILLALPPPSPQYSFNSLSRDH